MLYVITPVTGCTSDDIEHATLSFALSLAPHCTPNKSLETELQSNKGGGGEKSDLCLGYTWSLDGCVVQPLESNRTGRKLTVLNPSICFITSLNLHFFIQK